MAELVVGLGQRSYPIVIEKGCLAAIGQDLAQRKIAKRYCIIADTTVANLFGETVAQSLAQYSLSWELVSFPAGEASKNIDTFNQLLRTLAQKGFERKDGIIALGGGVTGDLAGFVAASYMRGIPFVQVPTSLLAQVDSSVGGKTGVDIPEGKNLVGAFYQPKIVYIDTNVLQTLPASEFLGGMAEVIKYGAIRDEAFFHYLQERRNQILSLENADITRIIHTCCTIKADVVGEDEQESNIRRILNFGHTIGHAVEAVSKFSIIHGFGVAIGMVAATRISRKKGLISHAEAERIIDLIREYGLPIEIPASLSREKIKLSLLTDKKSIAGKIAYILPVRVGETVITDEVEDELVDEVLRG